MTNPITIEERLMQKFDPRDRLHALLLCIVLDAYEHDRTGPHAKISWTLHAQARAQISASAGGVKEALFNTLESITEETEADDDDA